MADGDAGQHLAGPDRAQRSRNDVVRCGAELVGLSERFFARVFAGAIVIVGLASVASLVLLPTRGLPPGTPVTAAALATGLIVAATPLAVGRARGLYCALRRRPQLELGFVFVAAALVVHPALSGELWWPSCAILMALGIVAPLQRTLAYCLLVLAANFAGHLVAGDLGETAAVAVIGLWIGYPLWVATIAIATDRFVAHLLRLNAIQRRQPSDAGPRRVDAWTTEPARPARAGGSTAALATTGPSGQPAAQEGDGGPVSTDRLTARQIQVVALLADGLRYREVAACLSISERQVQRHVAESVARLGLRSSYELAAAVIAEGVVPDPARTTSQQ